MKALMFGWEFPPHILGGLGTASYGLTRGMAEQPDMDITFVIPKPWGDEDQSFLRIIGANSVPIVWKDVNYDYVKSRMEGKMSPDEFYEPNPPYRGRGGMSSAPSVAAVISLIDTLRKYEREQKEAQEKEAQQ